MPLPSHRRRRRRRATRRTGFRVRAGKQRERAALGRRFRSCVDGRRDQRRSHHLGRCRARRVTAAQSFPYDQDRHGGEATLARPRAGSRAPIGRLRPIRIRSDRLVRPRREFGRCTHKKSFAHANSRVTERNCGTPNSSNSLSSTSVTTSAGHHARTASKSVWRLRYHAPCAKSRARRPGERVIPSSPPPATPTDSMRSGCEILVRALIVRIPAYHGRTADTLVISSMDRITPALRIGTHGRRVHRIRYEHVERVITIDLPFIAFREDEPRGYFQTTMCEYFCNPINKELFDVRVSTDGFFSDDSLGVITSLPNEKPTFEPTGRSSTPFRALHAR